MGRASLTKGASTMPLDWKEPVDPSNVKLIMHAKGKRAFFEVYRDRINGLYFLRVDGSMFTTDFGGFKVPHYFTTCAEAKAKAVQLDEGRNDDGNQSA
jgi:hypothetical protein